MPSIPCVSNGDSERGNAGKLEPGLQTSPLSSTELGLLPFPTPCWNEQTHQKIAPWAVCTQALARATVMFTTRARCSSSSAALVWFHQEDNNKHHQEKHKLIHKHTPEPRADRGSCIFKVAIQGPTLKSCKDPQPNPELEPSSQKSFLKIKFHHSFNKYLLNVYGAPSPVQQPSQTQQILRLKEHFLKSPLTLRSYCIV